MAQRHPCLGSLDLLRRETAFIGLHLDSKQSTFEQDDEIGKAAFYTAGLPQAG